MPRTLRLLPLLGVLLLLTLAHPTSVEAHAAFARSEPPAGAVLPESPPEIRIWFTEPLEPDFSQAALLDASGNAVARAVSAVDASDRYQLVVSLANPLPNGSYTVAWGNVSAADGHTLQGYFGFRVGAGVEGAAEVTASGTTGNQTLLTISRWLAILGLAALIAIAPLVLWVIDPVARAHESLQPRLASTLRCYAVGAAALALLGSIVALAAQAMTIAPTASLPGAIARTLAETRYGQLWLPRLALLLLSIVALSVAFWGRAAWRRPALWLGVLLALVSPIPFSLLAHAAAETTGRTAALALDVLHLLAALIWAGGLLLLALVLAPALRSASAEARRASWRIAFPRFSVIALTTTGVLVLSGLYAAWLQVGTIEALLGTPYGRTLIVKGLLLIPALALGGLHLLVGWRGVAPGWAGRLARTLSAEAVIVVVVLLVVGRLIGLEPARAVIASREPAALTVPLSFTTESGARAGTLAISPGIPGVNTFTLTVAGEGLPEGSEGVLRFALPSQNIGEQELRLPAAGPQTLQADGPQVALAGDWQIEAIVRKIGAFAWSTQIVVPVSDSPPPTLQPNPAPLFDPWAIAGMLAVVAGIAAVAFAVALRTASASRRAASAVIGLALAVAGASLIASERIPVTAAPRAAATLAATPAASATPAAMASAHDHMAPNPAATPVLPAAGTPIVADGLAIAIEARPTAPGPVDIAVTIADAEGEPLVGATVVIFGEMSGMEAAGAGTPATEIAPGRYEATGVSFAMAGDWEVAVRVSPKGEATHVARFRLTVP
jgi:copper transport protein